MSSRPKGPIPVGKGIGVGQTMVRFVHCCATFELNLKIKLLILRLIEVSKAEEGHDQISCVKNISLAVEWKIYGQEKQTGNKNLNQTIIQSE